MLIYLFGLPAAGKNYIGQLLADEFGYIFYDGDVDLPGEMRDAIREGRPFSDAMRDNFYDTLIDRISELRISNQDLAFCQATFKERHRERIAAAHPDIVFVLVEADEEVRVERLSRGRNPVTVEYARLIADFFEPPSHPHFIITNNNGRQDAVRQLEGLLAWFSDLR